MQFNSLVYLIFLVVFCFAYFQLRGKWRIYFCLLSSYFFYAWWDWRFLGLILTSTLIDYGIGLKIQGEENPGTRKRFLWTSILVNLSILGFFKYFDFFTESLQSAFSVFGVQLSQPTLTIILPIGISFYTFQSMSYTIDVYRKKISAESDFIYFATYIAFFPQLVAGPILRSKEFIPQLKVHHTFNNGLLTSGLVLILWGYFQKIVVADSLAPFVDQCFDTPEFFSGLHLSVGVFFYALQIYGDFAGYSNIAIGSALILGFRYPRNFHNPYFAKSFQEFWRKWHITLSFWLRDYLYKSLGGNRKGMIFTLRNLMITMFLGGLWHGAAWTFVAWGILHGIYLVAERIVLEIGQNLNFRTPEIVLKLLQVSVVFVLVCLAWIFFRSPDFETAFNIVHKIGVGLHSGPYIVIQKLVIAKGLLLIGILWIIEIAQMYYRLDKMVLRNIGLRVAALVTLVMLIFLFGTFDQESFIYFQF